MADKIVLLDFCYSLFGMRVRVALAEKGVEYEYREEDLENKKYIDEVWKDKSPLLPLILTRELKPGFGLILLTKKLYANGREIVLTKGEELEAANQDFVDTLKLMEAHLGDKQYFGGDEFGYVDVALITFSSWFHAYETCGKFKIEQHCPKLIAWVKRCREKDSVSRSLADPNKVCEFVLGRRKKYGVE